MNNIPVLSVEELRTIFFTRTGVLKAVDGVTFEVHEGETLGVVGESGCGKSVTALSILQLVPSPPGRIVSGHIKLDGEDLLTKSQHEVEDIRGNRVAMIFQEPLTALNPLFTVGHQLAEAVRRHQEKSRAEAKEDVVDMLQRVGIPDPESRLRSYPHELSGGMRQRAMIAMALLARPRLLVADEPTTALDVTIQAQILELIRELPQQFGAATMMITHDLGVIAEMAERVIVMYAGRIVESAPVKALFGWPAHPYTLGLHQSTPSVAQKTERLNTIPGQVPTLEELNELVGCKFYARCPFGTDKCLEEEPPLEVIEEDHAVRCWHYEEVLEAQGVTLPRSVSPLHGPEES